VMNIGQDRQSCGTINPPRANPDGGDPSIGEEAF
jgi:hypothetical protein